MNSARRWFREWPSWPAVMVFVLFILATASVDYGILVGMRDSADLERRAEEVAMFRNGIDPYVDEKDMTYPPSALPVFAVTVPLGSVSFRRGLWIMLSLVSILAIGNTVCRDRWPTWACLSAPLVVAASKASRGGIALGQFHLIPVALILGAERLHAYPMIAGTLLGVALIKPTMAVPYVILIAVLGRWRTVLVAATIQAMLFGVTAWQLQSSPVHLTREWIRNASAQNSQGTIDLPTLLMKLAPPDLIRPTLVSLIILVIATFLFVKLRRKSESGLLALATFIAAIFTYHRHYDLVLLLPSLAYLCERAFQTGSQKLAGVAAFMAILMIFPSSTRLLGRWEGVYDLGFLLGSYVLLLIVTCSVALEPDRDLAPS